MNMSKDIQEISQTEVARAETEALALQDAEEQSAERFQSVRERLAASNQADEATQSPEFRDWMAARARTDEAWGRWALAMDALHG
jgi:hypothetical protein